MYISIQSLRATQSLHSRKMNFACILTAKSNLLFNCSASCHFLVPHFMKLLQVVFSDIVLLRSNTGSWSLSFPTLTTLCNTLVYTMYILLYLHQKGFKSDYCCLILLCSNECTVTYSLASIKNFQLDSRICSVSSLFCLKPLQSALCVLSTQFKQKTQARFKGKLENTGGGTIPG